MPYKSGWTDRGTALVCGLGWFGQMSLYLVGRLDSPTQGQLFCEGGELSVHCKLQRIFGVSPAKMDKRIEMPFKMWTRVGARNHVLHRRPGSPTGRGTFWGIHEHAQACPRRVARYSRRSRTVAARACRRQSINSTLDAKEQQRCCHWLPVPKRLAAIYSSAGGSVAEWLACWTQAQKGLGSNRSRDSVG